MSLSCRDDLHSFHGHPILVFILVIFSWMASIVVLNLSASPLNNFIMVFCSSSNSLPRPSLCATELSGLSAGLELLVGATISSNESTRNISSLIGNPSRRLPIASISLTFSFNSVTCASRKRRCQGLS